VKASGARMVEWFRVDPWPRIRAVLLTGPPILTLGALVVALSFLTRASPSARVAAVVAGMALVAGGALYTMLAMQRVLYAETFVVLRTDGIGVQNASGETFVPWDEVEDARWDSTRGALVIVRTGGAEVTVSKRFAGIHGSDLARRILGTKRKAAMHLLR
jgi:hypothetical protein